VLAAGLLVLSGVAIIASSSNLWVYQFREREPAHLLQASSPRPAPAPDVLTVMTWNIKFGGGRIDFFFDCFGDRVVMTEAEVLRHLRGLAAKINEVNPDILFVQEADIDSTRTAYVNQVQWLLEHTHLSYAAFASHWQVRWIPNRGLGRMNSGNAVLSRWPLRDARRIALPLMREQSALTRFLYLRRNALAARVAIPHGRPVHVLNTHLEAYSRDDTKKRQLETFLRVLDELAATGGLVIAGGDLNALPPGARRVKGFDDTACKDDFVADDYSAERAWLGPLYDQYASAVTLSAYLGSERDYFSHTVKGTGWWNRMVDYLFSNGVWAGPGVVHQDERTGMATMPLSDHAPLSARLILRPRPGDVAPSRGRPGTP
jgi:endonuclease/exonuclease/phosphatase family metal-dependent hydrolase